MQSYRTNPTMESASADAFIKHLTNSHRVVVLGGLAVIAHGLSRSTLDGDIWLDPMDDVGEWCVFLEKICHEFGVSLHRLPGWVCVNGEGLITAVRDTNMVRIHGLDYPLDVFREPNEIEVSDFNDICGRATLRADGTLLPHPLDLIQSKLETGREKDLIDIQHLESMVRADYKVRLPQASIEEATRLLDRFSDWQVLLAALENPSSAVRDLAMTHLREFAADGDPFSQAIIEGRELP